MTLMGKILLSLSLLCTLAGCRYGFTGYTITAETVVVKYFQNQAPIQSADLSQVFTNKLEQRIVRETPMRLVQSNGEIEFSGTITNYSVRPLTVSGTDRTQESELTLTVQVDFKNTSDESTNFRESFRASEQFDANVDLTGIEEDLLDSITDQIVAAIFNRAFADW